MIKWQNSLLCRGYEEESGMGKTQREERMKAGKDSWGKSTVGCGRYVSRAASFAGEERGTQR